MTFPEGGKFIFNSSDWLVWVISAVYIVVFGLPILYILVNRNKPTFSTRSPKLLIFGFIMMMGSCLLNTYRLTKQSKKFTLYAVQCDLSVLITVTVFYGLMAAYYVRMWRVYLCFDLY